MATTYRTGPRGGSGLSRAGLFTLPDESALRFTLLIGAALAASLFIGNTMYISTRGNSFGESLARCTAMAGSPPPPGPDFSDWSNGLDRCLAGTRAEMLTWGIGWALF